MSEKKNILLGFIVTVGVFQSELAIAAEDSESSFLPPIWPLLALIIFIVVFRKQLNCVPPQNFDHEDISDSSIPEAEPPAGSIDLREPQGQCQASTAKGTRCKRTINLEDKEFTVDGKDYLLSVCKQHNTDNLKPFADLIK